MERRAEQRPRKPVKEEEGGAEEGRRKVEEVSRGPSPPRGESFTKMERSTVYVTTKRVGKKMPRNAYWVSHQGTLGV